MREYVCVCACACTETSTGTYYSVLVEIRGQPWESILSFCHVGPQDPDQVDKLDDKDLYLLSHHTRDSIFDNIHSRVCHVTEYVPSFQG